MTKKYLESILKIGISDIQPHFDKISAEKHKFHSSHYLIKKLFQKCIGTKYILIYTTNNIL